MTGTIIFNGTSSQDFGLVVEKLPPSVHALRRGNIIQIPGRNGVIVHEDGSFDTYTQKYEIWFSDPELEFRRRDFQVYEIPDLFWRTKEDIQQVMRMNYTQQCDPFAAEAEHVDLHTEEPAGQTNP